MIDFSRKNQTFLLKLICGPANVQMFSSYTFLPNLFLHWFRTFILIAKYRSINPILHICVTISSIILWVYFLHKLLLDMVTKKEAIRMTKTMKISYWLLRNVCGEYCANIALFARQINLFLVFAQYGAFPQIITLGCVVSNYIDWCIPVFIIQASPFLHSILYCFLCKNRICSIFMCRSFEQSCFPT